MQIPVEIQKFLPSREWANVNGFSICTKIDEVIRHNPMLSAWVKQMRNKPRQSFGGYNSKIDAVIYDCIRKFEDKPQIGEQSAKFAASFLATDTSALEQMPARGNNVLPEVADNAATQKAMMKMWKAYATSFAMMKNPAEFEYLIPVSGAYLRVIGQNESTTGACCFIIARVPSAESPESKSDNLARNWYNAGSDFAIAYAAYAAFRRAQVKTITATKHKPFKLSALAFLCSAFPEMVITDGSSAVVLPVLDVPDTSESYEVIVPEEASVFAPVGAGSLSRVGPFLVYVKSNIYITGMFKMLRRWHTASPLAEANISHEVFDAMKKTKVRGQGSSGFMLAPTGIKWRWIPPDGQPTDFPVYTQRIPVVTHEDTTVAFLADRVLDLAPPDRSVRALIVSGGEKSWTLILTGESQITYISNLKNPPGFTEKEIVHSSISGQEMLQFLPLLKSVSPTFDVTTYPRHQVAFGNSDVYVSFPLGTFSGNGTANWRDVQIVANGYTKSRMPVVQVNPSTTDHFGPDPFQGQRYVIPQADRILPVLTKVVPKDDNRYGLNGVGWLKYNGESFMAATDGSRLTYFHVPPIPSNWDERKFLIPRIAGIGLPVSLTETGKMLIVGENIAARPIVGAFPPFWNVLPEKENIVAYWSIQEVLDGMTTLLPIASDPAHAIRFDNSGKVSARNVPEQLYKEIMLPVPKLCEGFPFGINAEFVKDAMEALLAFGGRSVTMHVAQTLSPVIFRSPEVPTLTCVIMPIRLD